MTQFQILGGGFRHSAGFSQPSVQILKEFVLTQLTGYIVLSACLEKGLNLHQSSTLNTELGPRVKDHTPI